MTHFIQSDDFILSYYVRPVLCEQAVVAGIQQAHAEQLANMRIQDLNVSLKPLSSVNNPILRKRKLLGLVSFCTICFFNRYL